MSYIRTLSNPEGLYIWGTSSKERGECVSIAAKGKELVAMPRNVFRKLLLLWHDIYCNGLPDDDAVNTEKRVVFEGATLTLNDNWCWDLNYPTWPEPISMYEVTLMYIITQNDLKSE
jgi:hypothetical protein